MGGISIGLASMGGVSLGLLTLGGAAFGGLALGLVAAGGSALGWFAAEGGLAVAGTFALGGLAIAKEANSEAARGWFVHHPWLNLTRLRDPQPIHPSLLAARFPRPPLPLAEGQIETVTVFGRGFTAAGAAKRAARGEPFPTGRRRVGR